MTTNSLFLNELAHQRHAQVAADVTRCRTTSSHPHTNDSTGRRHARGTILAVATVLTATVIWLASVVGATMLAPSPANAATPTASSGTLNANPNHGGWSGTPGTSRTASPEKTYRTGAGVGPNASPHHAIKAGPDNAHQ